MNIEKAKKGFISCTVISFFIIVVPRILFYCIDSLCINFFGLSLSRDYLSFESFFMGMWHSFWYSFFSEDIFYKTIVNSLTIGCILAIIIIVIFSRNRKNID